jgi:hypothetical protein
MAVRSAPSDQSGQPWSGPLEGAVMVEQDGDTPPHQLGQGQVEQQPDRGGQLGDGHGGSATARKAASSSNQASSQTSR